MTPLLQLTIFNIPAPSLDLFDRCRRASHPEAKEPPGVMAGVALNVRYLESSWLPGRTVSLPATAGGPTLLLQ